MVCGVPSLVNFCKFKQKRIRSSRDNPDDRSIAPCDTASCPPARLRCPVPAWLSPSIAVVAADSGLVQKYFFSRPPIVFLFAVFWHFFSFRVENTRTHLQIHACALSNEEKNNRQPTAAATLFRRSYAAAGSRARRVEHVSLNALAVLSSYRCRPKRENTKTRPAKFKNIPRKKPTDENSPRRTHQKKGKPRFLFAPPHSQEQSTQPTAASASTSCGARRSAPRYLSDRYPD